jgi:Fe-S oxidoreductase
VLVVLGYPDVFTAGDHVPQVLAHKPLGLEGMDEMLIDFMRIKHLHEEDIGVLPEGKGWLLAEFGGETEDEAAARAQELVDDLKRGSHPPAIKLVRDKARQEKVWLVRRAGLGATAFVPRHPEAWEGWEDTAVPPERVGDYLRDLKALFHKYGYDSVLYGHFGDGCIHCRINFGLRSEDGIAKWRRFLSEGADLVVRYGGSISGEHGDGQSKAELLGKMYGPELIEAFREFKAIWDPAWKMNPGKVVDPYPITSNLRLGPDYRPPHPKTHFAFPDDHGSFAHAAMRCVGVGECRRHRTDGTVMCPSYMATREEMYATRGRAHLLFEMLHGGVLERGWKSDAAEAALDLCLACKGCKSDCPVNVDMATYKAEFRAHHYEGRLRPRAAYTMGLIHLWSHLAGHAPRLANFLTQTPGIAALVKRAGGIARQRAIPAYAPEPFHVWFGRHEPANPGGPRVVLWPDTFNDYFRVPTAIAAVRVLEAAGFHVVIPRRRLCCGRPLYDWGRLDAAKAFLRRIMDCLRDEIEAGVPLVGLEPACLAVFRDELTSLFPNDPLARKLSKQSLLLSEFLDRHAKDLRLPRVNGKAALVQVHCHHHAIMKFDAEKRVLGRLGLDHEVLPSGCCGMAGSFGFEAEKYAVSMRAAERVLLPRVRQAAPGTLILADGFSCREQIEQATGRRTLHLAELIASTLGRGEATAPTRQQQPRPEERRVEMAPVLALVIAAGLGLAAMRVHARRQHR